MSISENSQKMTLRIWLALFVLALSTFNIVTTELAPIGLLTPMANALATSESYIGMTVSLYAWVGALSALVASVFLGAVGKKNLLIALSIVLAVSNGLAASAETFESLMLARVIGAVAHGAFWSIIGVSAASIVPSNYIGVATSIVFGGVSVASVFGVPISNYIGMHIGWRSAFMVMSGLSVLSLVGIASLVPQISEKSSVGIGAIKAVFKSSSLIKIYFATILTISAHFTAFTYIEPMLNSLTHISEEFVPVLLLVFGVAGIAGNVITALFIDKHLKTIAVLSVLFAASMLVLIGEFHVQWYQAHIGTALAIWGATASCIFVALQTWVLRLASEQAFPASALYVAFFNLAIGIGASLGAWLVASYNVSFLYIFAGVAMALSLVFITIVPMNFENVQRTQEA
ncbi:MFS transporter [Vibrio hippocampi]|uniref:Sugar efflux transporter B n=1 Tax=Vibrio hippocampi TaxID=654686 RepID=A0ABN8DMP5_9VIBR|nr:MFS transporter [Vibrio hippocampi]CAH0529997.1 Sugar efflux transporter B [Vibrio hippocampi]